MRESIQVDVVQLLIYFLDLVFIVPNLLLVVSISFSHAFSTSAIALRSFGLLSYGKHGQVLTEVPGQIVL